MNEISKIKRLLLLALILPLVGLAFLVAPQVIAILKARVQIDGVWVDLRSLAIALESYYIDHDVYPAMHPLDQIYPAEVLAKAGLSYQSVIEVGRPGFAGVTTPIGYLQGPLLQDPFSPLEPKNSYLYFTDGQDWQLISAGPDGDYDADPVKGGGGLSNWDEAYVRSIVYDPTNGEFSGGDIMRSIKGVFEIRGGLSHGPPRREGKHVRYQAP